MYLYVFEFREISEREKLGLEVGKTSSVEEAEEKQALVEAQMSTVWSSLYPGGLSLSGCSVSAHSSALVGCPGC